jgi:hypothetical protein
MATQRSTSKSWNILNWNARGINSADKKKAVRAKIEESGCSVLESKVDHVDCSLMKKIAPKSFSKFSFVPSMGASGGIIMWWKDSILKGEVLRCQDFAITIAFTSRHSEQSSLPRVLIQHGGSQVSMVRSETKIKLIF